MLLILHILIAISSLIFSGYVFYSPSNIKLRISGVLITLTLVTGTYLVLSMHSPLVTACSSGLVYLSAVMTTGIGARRRLSSAKEVKPL